MAKKIGPPNKKQFGALVRAALWGMLPGFMG